MEEQVRKNSEHRSAAAATAARLIVSAQLAKAEVPRSQRDSPEGLHMRDQVAAAAIAHAAVVKLINDQVAFGYENYQVEAAKALLLHLFPIEGRIAARLASLADQTLTATTSATEEAENRGCGWALDTYEMWLQLPEEEPLEEDPSIIELTVRALTQLRESSPASTAESV